MKKTISVIGSCMARNIFDAPCISSAVEVQNFGFQITPLTCFDESLEIPLSEIRKINASHFEKRMLDYNLNKTMLTQFENKITDYVVIDLVACSFLMYEISLNGKKTIARMWKGDKFLSLLGELPWFKDRKFTWNKLSYKAIPKETIYRSLDQFIEWLSTTYRLEQIVICIPSFAKKYLNKDLKVCEYSEKKRKQYDEEEAFVVELSRYLIERMSGCLVYNYPSNMIGEEYAFKEPLPYHFTNMDYLRQAEKMISLLGIDINNSYLHDISPVSYMIETWASKYFSTREKLLDTEKALLNEESNDSFIGTSVASVLLAPWGKDLLSVKSLENAVDKQKKELELIWCKKYLELKRLYTNLIKYVLDMPLSDSQKNKIINEVREMEKESDIFEIIKGEQL